MERKNLTLWATAVCALVAGCGAEEPKQPAKPETAPLVKSEPKPAPQALPAPKPPAPESTAVKAVVEPELWIEKRTPQLKKLARSVSNLAFPDHDGRAQFAERVTYSDTAPGKPTDSVANLSVRMSTWAVGEERTVARANLTMWRALLDTVDYFERTKFYIVKGDFTDPVTFQTEIGFTGLARTADGTRRAIAATQDVTWRRTDENAWRITHWRLNELKLTDGAHQLFREVLDEVVPDADARERARTSEHEVMLRTLVSVGQTSIAAKYKPFFSVDTTGLHPGVSVVDVDRDGFDDVYVMVRWGKNRFFRNRGDGTFEEVGAKLGLDIDGTSSSAVFGDFDNDGDTDLILGRYLERSLYLRNEDGRFVDRSKELVALKLPYLVTSMSAVDYNRDGLLDVYFATYGVTSNRVRQWAERFLPREHAKKLLAALTPLMVSRNNFTHSDWYLNRTGPPNILLVNRGGGKFELAPEHKQIEDWRNTLQATWADYDGDGDPDVYVTNDFAPDHLFRNDGPKGFTEVSGELAGDAMAGFGMGATWGDYDNDGRQDLYVSNMFSKAGLRITAKIDKLDPRLRHFASGNLLFRNTGEKLELVSGLKPPKMAVARADWSWAGQFADLDNDGFLDLYVSSGHFTPPEGFEGDKDL